MISEGKETDDTDNMYMGVSSLFDTTFRNNIELRNKLAI